MRDWKKFKIGVMFIICFLFVSLICFETYALVLYHVKVHCSLPGNIGNFKRVREQLRINQERGDFFFAVVGDTKGCGTFERIYEKLKNEPLSFLVLLGDCVRKGTEGYHSYFRAEWAERKCPFPVFYVIGNHDIDESDFSVSRFEQTYGPTNFFFQYRHNLFVFLRILDNPYSNETSLDFLENVLAKKRSLNKRVFLFMHIPPIVSSDYYPRKIEGSKRFVSLINQYHVNYVIGGDYHGYARVKRGGTVYLVTGGGGAHLKRTKYSNFHHAIVFHIGKNFISERILAVKRHEDMEDQVERYILAEFVPLMKKNRLKIAIANIIVICGIVFSLIMIIRYQLNI